MSAHVPYLAYSVSAALVLAAAACSTPRPAQSPAPSADSTDSADIDDAPKKIRVGTEAAFEPFNHRDSSGQVTGLDIELIRAIADRAGISVEIIVEPIFAKLFDGLAADRFDVVASTVSITPERQKRFAFTRAYFETAVVVLVRAAADQPRTPTGLRGRPVAAPEGTTSVAIAKALDAESVIEVRYSKDAIAALMEGRIDAYVLDEVEARQLARDDSRLVVLAEPAARESYGFVVAQSNPALRDRLDTELAAMLADGSVSALLEQFGLETATR